MDKYYTSKRWKICYELCLLKVCQSLFYDLSLTYVTSINGNHNFHPLLHVFPRHPSRNQYIMQKRITSSLACIVNWQRFYTWRKPFCNIIPQFFVCFSPSKRILRVYAKCQQALPPTMFAWNMIISNWKSSPTTNFPLLWNCLWKQFSSATAKPNMKQTKLHPKWKDQKLAEKLLP